MRSASGLWRDDRGAVAPILTIALFGLVGVAGLAFDYSRLASLDTEMQSAADQAALAAASQLDGATNAQARAKTAAEKLLTNSAIFAKSPGQSQTGTISISDAKVEFFSAYTDSSQTAATGDSDSHFVRVTVDSKTAYYALTPIVGLLPSSGITGTAVAGVGSAICNVPPVMMCNPNEPTTNTNVNYDFDAAALRGHGLRLVTGDASAPGNFGFLETNFGSGAQNLARALGFNSPPGDCNVLTGVETKTGMNQVVMNALNTRFDINTNGNNTCPSGGTCSPSVNVRKDVVTKNTNSNGCDPGNNGWQEAKKPYAPPNDQPITSNYPEIMGHPRDMCHAAPTATCGMVGTGSWDRDAYFKVNYGWDSSTWKAQTGLSASATRYEVYIWEIAHPNAGLGYGGKAQSVSGGLTGYAYPVCLAPGLTPAATVPDRRRISVAVINCAALHLNGHATGVAVKKWIDVFLVEPSLDRARTSKQDVYVEVIGETTAGSAGSTTGQVIRRDVPYLLQ